ncbi:thiol reductant ABC exporter subunit CydD [Pengzhenrongella frigida]|uniref:Thiol reductant ABC exporter subunit CydD n=1 Tax=Pengzhenrongella frigida TaxID=1259133 RepID=A0A4Q5N3A4_9MICO|nr:thiol reductant ABC exporter subunit CydD [Cellulomonas sp. HLT2-17]RYV52699.1 thiol reductant ABC exporter subunit CydD [Cellulomonas sp. HLT2-17]
MKPLDPRLLRHTRGARRYILITATTGAVTAALVVAQALLIAHAVAPVIDGTAGWAHVATLLPALAAVVALRAGVLVVQESSAHRSATHVIAELREQVLTRTVELGPRWLAAEQGPAVVTLVTRGLDDLEPYFVRYLPQLLLAATVTPATLAVVLGLNLVAALTIAFTLPLIPVFMWLIGVLTQKFAAERLATMQRLGAQLMDLLAGLGTLKALGREQGPGARVGELGRAYTRTTMATLRVAFLSGAVLEFLSSIAVALVAVGIGTGLVYGRIDLVTGLAVLMLAPEVYRPIREVGAQFHASADGIAAAAQSFAVIEHPLPPRGTRPAPDLRQTDIVLDAVSVAAPGRATWAPWQLEARLRPGRVLALVGPSGAGKSTAASVVLGLLTPDDGAVRLVPATPAGDSPASAGVSLSDVDPASWWAQIAWVPQRPVIVPGTVRANVLGDAAAAVDDRARVAAHDTGFDEVLAQLPHGWDSVLGQGGVGLSLGQRQRLALTRALLGTHPLVVLDEPTAHLDARAEEHVLTAVDRLRAQGRTVLVIAHRQALIARADDVVTVRSRATDPADGDRPDAPRTTSTPSPTSASARAEPTP